MEQVNGKVGVATLTADRLKGLSDGAASIVLTLLVLGIEVPDNHDFSAQGLISFLGKVEYEMSVYALSFVLIAGYWMQHNVMFHYFKHVTRWLIWLNLLFLFFLTLLPFTTQLIGDYANEPKVIIIYGFTNIACSLSLAWVWWEGSRNPKVVAMQIERSISVSMLKRIMGGAVLSAVAIAIAFLNVRLSHVLFLSIPFLSLSHRRVDQHLSGTGGEA